MKIEITRLNHSGEGIGKLNGKIIFVPKTLPQDIVEVEIIEEHKNYLKGIVTKFYSKSNKHISPLCPHYNECGGCQLMNLEYKEQLEYKKEKVINILNKYTSLNIDNINITASPNQYHYRNKIALQVKNGIIGLFSYNTNNIVEVNSCLLISKAMNQVIEIIPKKLNLKDVNQIIIREAKDKLMVQVIGKIEEDNLINVLSPYVESLYLNDKHLIGQEYIIDQLGNYEFQVSPKSFFQVNHYQTINLYNQIKKYLGNNNRNILDLYCGTGTIGIYVSNCCNKVTGIELNQSSVKDAK